MGKRKYFGLDLGEYFSQISYMEEEDNDATSISPIIGSHSYLVPTVVGKRSGILQWFVGEEALKFQVAHHILSKAYKREKIVVDGEEFEAIDLLEIFIRRMLSFTNSVGCNKDEDLFVICIDHASQLAVETLLQITGNLGINKEQVKICSRQECFCYYTMNQEAALHLHEVLLLDYWEHSFKAYYLKKDTTVEPNVVRVEELSISKLEKLKNEDGLTDEEFMALKDETFHKVLDEILPGHMISAVYLVGNGFEGEWMKKSLSRLCAGRRVFYGMNLYTKGACFYAKAISQPTTNPKYLYLGGGNLLYNLCVKAYHKGSYQYQVLVPAGFNWQDAGGTLDFIITGEEEPEITTYLKSLKGEEDIAQTHKLTGLMVSSEKTTRIRIHAYAISKERIRLEVTEIGFGEIAPGNKGKWDFEIGLG